MIITMIKKAKEVHPEKLMIVHVGKFFKLFGKDAYIVSYYFKYKLLRDNTGIPNCGFTDKLLPKVVTKLQDEKIDYFVLERKENYQVVEKKEFKDLNRYNKIYQKAKIYGDNMLIFDDISKIVNDKIYSKDMSQKLNKILELIKNE